MVRAEGRLMFLLVVGIICLAVVLLCVIQAIWTSSWTPFRLAVWPLLAALGCFICLRRRIEPKL